MIHKITNASFKWVVCFLIGMSFGYAVKAPKVIEIEKVVTKFSWLGFEVGLAIGIVATILVVLFLVKAEVFE